MFFYTSLFLADRSMCILLSVYLFCFCRKKERKITKVKKRRPCQCTYTSVLKRKKFSRYAVSLSTLFLITLSLSLRLGLSFLSLGRETKRKILLIRFLMSPYADYQRAMLSLPLYMYVYVCMFVHVYTCMTDSRSGGSFVRTVYLRYSCLLLLL